MIVHNRVMWAAGFVLTLAAQSQAASTVRAYTDAKVWATQGGQEVDGSGTDVLTAVAAGQDPAGGNFSAAATASMGLLRADSGITVSKAPGRASSNYYYYGDAHADAEAYFTDTWTFTGKPLDTPGTLQLTISFDGTTTGDALSGAFANVWGRYDVSLIAETVNGNVLGQPLQFTTGNVASADLTQTLTLNFLYGRPILVSADLIAYAQIASQNDSYYISGTGTSSFEHTAKFEALTVDDGTGTFTSNYTLQTDSGAVYPFQAAAVPEPATLSAAGVGATLLLLRRRASR